MIEVREAKFDDIDGIRHVFQAEYGDYYPYPQYYDAEMLAKAQRLGLRVGQRGVSHRPRIHGEPSGGDPRVILRAFKELIALYRHINSDADAW